MNFVETMNLKFSKKWKYKKLNNNFAQSFMHQIQTLRKFWIDLWAFLRGTCEKQDLI